MRRTETQPTSLLIIPEPSVRALIADLMRDLGIAVRAADTGASALASLSKRPVPRLILVELDLPDMSARMFLEALAKRKAGSKIPCAVIADAARAPAPWAPYFLVKPISIDTLLEIARVSCGVGKGPKKARRPRKKP